ncbi:hypothetical protein BDK51DRAFT_41127 [Blyttiomyces helicus]|uniref:Uncharacterized protein n=1 Tax=Blyttiomyces helicus TaxID=388810 RepID=A0A4P9W4D2_9FUNG|nr:hypothetical protein BDK51DRAFT_41127 [Blyttiomyces helicus]|eukprot:RKO87209.1 hypothetical protein BDK51DRAFT_41127 [Blyttiomyces helicus]
MDVSRMIGLCGQSKCPRESLRLSGPLACSLFSIRRASSPSQTKHPLNANLAHSLRQPSLSLHIGSFTASVTASSSEEATAKRKGGGSRRDKWDANMDRRQDAPGDTEASAPPPAANPLPPNKPRPRSQDDFDLDTDIDAMDVEEPTPAAMVYGGGSGGQGRYQGTDEASLHQLSGKYKGGAEEKLVDRNFFNDSRIVWPDFPDEFDDSSFFLR